MSQLVPLRPELKSFLADYLPKYKPDAIFVTLTYAASLDSRIAAERGIQTIISHAETKTMTHYLRSKHDAILIGIGTAEADDPGLNCRFQEDEKQHKIRPIIVDPSFRWPVSDKSRVIVTATEGDGLGPWVLTRKGTREMFEQKTELIESCGGRVIEVTENERLDWKDVLDCLKKRGIGSIMIEGGATIINDVLQRSDLVDSVVVTIGPRYLGSQGVEVSPGKGVELKEINWWKGEQDVVLAARLEKKEI